MLRTVNSDDALVTLTLALWTYELSSVALLNYKGATRPFCLNLAALVTDSLICQVLGRAKLPFPHSRQACADKWHVAWILWSALLLLLLHSHALQSLLQQASCNRRPETLHCRSLTKFEKERSTTSGSIQSIVDCKFVAWQPDVSSILSGAY